MDGSWGPRGREIKYLEQQGNFRRRTFMEGFSRDFLDSLQQKQSKMLEQCSISAPEADAASPERRPPNLNQI
jgi:hypothetical protein